MPVDYNSLSSEEQQQVNQGQQIKWRKGLLPHWASCPKAADFKRKK
jgi:hypothetical protein